MESRKSSLSTSTSERAGNVHNAAHQEIPVRRPTPYQVDTSVVVQNGVRSPSPSNSIASESSAATIRDPSTLTETSENAHGFSTIPMDPSTLTTTSNSYSHVTTSLDSPNLATAPIKTPSTAATSGDAISLTTVSGGSPSRATTAITTTTTTNNTLPETKVKGIHAIRPPDFQLQSSTTGTGSVSQNGQFTVTSSYQKSTLHHDMGPYIDLNASSSVGSFTSQTSSAFQKGPYYFDSQSNTGQPTNHYDVNTVQSPFRSTSETTGQYYYQQPRQTIHLNPAIVHHEITPMGGQDAFNDYMLNIDYGAIEAYNIAMKTPDPVLPTQSFVSAKPQFDVAKAVFTQADANRDGSISREEFHQWVQGGVNNSYGGQVHSRYQTGASTNSVPPELATILQQSGLGHYS